MIGRFVIAAFLLSIHPASAAWSGWREVPGGGTTDAPIAAAAKSSVVIFAKGIADKKVSVNVMTP